MGAFFALAGLVRFFRSRKSREVVQVITKKKKAHKRVHIEELD